MTVTILCLLLGIPAIAFGVLWFFALMMADTQTSELVQWMSVALTTFGIISTCYGVYHGLHP